MQSGAATAICNDMGPEINKFSSTASSSGAEEHGNFSLELWKKALRHACERICPIRAGGHECGCLHFLSKLVWSDHLSFQLYKHLLHIPSFFFLSIGLMWIKL